MINIAELLKDTPRGTKLYSPLFGEVEFSHVTNSRNMVIYVLTPRGFKHFTSDGNAIVEYINGVMMASQECLLFPSKECRTWENFKLPTKPPFKAHDWVVSNGQPAIIYELKQNYYLGKYLNGHDFCHKYADEDKLHLWTIEDAKDGDVLATAIGNCPFIYRKTSYNNNLAYYYAGLDVNGNLTHNEPSYHFGPVEKVVPATKEQRDLLFRKMKEAGYEWCAEKKELRRIKEHYDISNFHAGMPVLVRDSDNIKWKYVVFSHREEGALCTFCACGLYWFQCIPFKDDTKHLLGTTDMCPEEYINW